MRTLALLTSFMFAAPVLANKHSVRKPVVAGDSKEAKPAPAPTEGTGDASKGGETKPETKPSKKPVKKGKMTKGGEKTETPAPAPTEGTK